MSATFVLEAVRHALFIALLVATPLLMTELAVGLAVSLVQAVTQIQEQTLTFVPKLLAIAAITVVALPWILRILVDYVVQTLRSIPTIVP